MKLTSSLFRNLRTYGPVRTLGYCFRYALLLLLKLIPGAVEVRCRVLDFSMYLRPGEGGLSRKLFIYGVREADMVKYMEEELHPGDVVLNIGANIGYTLLLQARAMGRSGRIIAFEPDRRSIALLCRNVELNGLGDIVEIHPEAVGEREGTAFLVLASPSNLSHLDPRKELAAGGSTPAAEVPVRDVCSVIREAGGVDMVSMDLEGYEALVLQRMMALHPGETSLMPRRIVFEAHAGKYTRYHDDIGKVVSRCIGAGYSVKAVTSAKEEARALRDMGYRPDEIVRSDQTLRGIYRDIAEKDFRAMLTEEGLIRTVVLARDPQGENG